MKNKVCVVTWSGGTNYGTNLQAYALIKKLKLLGYDASMKGSIVGNVNYLLHPAFVLERVANKLKQKQSKKKVALKDKKKRKKI